MDRRRSFVAGRLLQICAAVRETHSAQLTEEGLDLLSAAVSLTVEAPVDQLANRCLYAAMQYAQATLSAAEQVPTTTTTAPQRQFPPAQEEKLDPAKTVSRHNANPGAHAAQRHEHEHELSCIRELLSSIRAKAVDMQSQVKVGDSIVSSHLHRLAGVVQSVADADKGVRALEDSGSAPSKVSDLLRRVPVVGPTILAPIADVVVQIFWLLFIVACTVITLSAMLVLPKSRLL